MNAEELLKKYAHAPEEFPVLAEQTHKVLRDGRIVNERININANIIHYVKDTALLISVIDGRLSGAPYDHVIYLDKSARPVSWLVNLFWEDLAAGGPGGRPVRRPRHSYINIDRAPWFRNAGISVTGDGRRKDSGELATYRDFANNIRNLTPRQIAEIRALYIEGGIEEESADWVTAHPTVLDGKRVLIVDEVSRTGATLDIARHLFRLAVPGAKAIDGAYYWHPEEPVLKAGEETVLTSLPVWYDPDTLTGRGIGAPDPRYYRRLYEEYEALSASVPAVDKRKFRTFAYSSSVFSAPLLDKDGNALDLAREKKTRRLCRDLTRLRDEFRAGRLFFTPPVEWMDFDGYDAILERQGVELLPPGGTERDRERLMKSPLFYINFVTRLKSA